MVAKKSSERLPSGWTVQFRAPKTGGRKVRVYQNLETGKEFFSKDDLFNYIKAGSHHSGKPQSTNRNITRHAETTLSQPVNDKNELPKWLPKGWKVEVKLRKSGLLIGKEYKCYVDPLNSCKFYSKLEVLRYLKTVRRKTRRTRDVKEVKGESCISKKKTSTGTCSGVAPVPTSSPGPDTGPDTSPAKAPASASTSASASVDKVVLQKCEVEDLPAGWIKEIKIRKNSKVIRKDPYYTDPVHGYVFRSKKAALHYVATGEISRHVIKPKNSELKDEITPSSAAKRQKLEHSASRRQLFAGKVGSDLSDPELSKNEGSKIMSSNTVSPEAKVTFSSKDEIIQGKHTLDNAIQECVETKEKGAPKRSSLLKAESSTRGGDKRSPLSDAGVLDKSRGKMEFAKNRPVSTPAPDILQEKKFLGTVVEKSSVRETQARSRKSKDKQESNLPPRSSKRLAGIEPDQGVNLALGERALKAEVMKCRKTEAIQDAGLTSDGLLDGPSAQLETRPETEVADHASTNTDDPLQVDPSNTCMKPLEDQVAPEELHLNLETEQINENPEPELSFLFGSDPCLEFAFKTLLGELPLDDAPLEGPILTQAADTLQDDLLESEIEKSSTGRSQVSRNNFAPLEGPILTQAGNKLQDDLLESETKKSSTRRGRVSRNKSKSKTPFELPLDNAPLEGPILIQAGDTLQGDLLDSETKEGSSGRGRVSKNKSKNKKEVNLPRRSSKRLAGAEPELVADAVASERALLNASRKPNDKSTISSTNLLDEANQRVGAEPKTELQTQLSNTDTSMQAEQKTELQTQLSNTEPKTELQTQISNTDTLMQAEPETELQTQLSNTDTSMQAEPLNKMESSFEDLGAPKEQQQTKETQEEELEQAEPNLSFSFVDCWSDPCLDFAFKTLTGIIPIDESFVQGDFQAQVDISQNHRNSSLALPDFGSPSLFQTDISSQFDTPEKSVLGQQSSSVTSTFLPSGNVNFPSCSGVHSQQQCLEGNKDLHQKVKS